MAFLREGDHAIVHFVQAVNCTGPSSVLGQIIINQPQSGAEDADTGFLQNACRSRRTFRSFRRSTFWKSLNIRRYGTIGAFYCFKPKDTIFATAIVQSRMPGAMHFLLRSEISTARASVSEAI